jgi:hypothetical protein
MLQATINLLSETQILSSVGIALMCWFHTGSGELEKASYYCNLGMQMLEHLRAKNYWLHQKYGPLASNAYHICLLAIGTTNPSPDTRFSMLSQFMDIINYEKDISLSWDARSKTVNEYHELLGNN